MIGLRTRYDISAKIACARSRYLQSAIGHQMAGRTGDFSKSDQFLQDSLPTMDVDG
jgi:hypothetical protein